MNDEPPIIGFWEYRKNIIIFALGAVVIVMLCVLVWLAIQVANNNAVESTTSGNVTVTNSANGNATPTEQEIIPKVGTITQPQVPVSDMAQVEVDITSVGFSPATITISKGQSVIWTVRGGNGSWIVSNPSDLYPVKAVCAGANSLFNSCGELKLGDSFRMVFNNIGTWTYYDKLNPNSTGTVVVQ